MLNKDEFLKQKQELELNNKAIQEEQEYQEYLKQQEEIKKTEERQKEKEEREKQSLINAKAEWHKNDMMRKLKYLWMDIEGAYNKEAYVNDLINFYEKSLKKYGNKNK